MQLLSSLLLCHIVMQPGVPHEDTNAMLLEASGHQNYEPNKPLYFINCSVSGILLYQHKQLVQDHTLKLPALQNRPLVLSESFPDCLTPFLLTKSLVLPLKELNHLIFERRYEFSSIMWSGAKMSRAGMTL